MAKRGTNKRAAREDFDPEERRIGIRLALEGISVLTAKDFLDPEDPECLYLAALEERARRDIEELARQIRCCCSDKKWTSYQKRVACEQLVKLAILSTDSIYGVAKDFLEPFREIAEELPHFPCLFPAHAHDLRVTQRFMWDHFNLGKHHELKLRASHGRKTFSKETWVNALLIRYIGVVHEVAENEFDPGWDGLDKLQEVALHVPLTPDPKNFKQWLAVIWELLLQDIPEPDRHPRLRQLVVRPSLNNKRTRRDGTVGEKTQAHNVRAAIKAKLGVYLKRMLNDLAVHK